MARILVLGGSGFGSGVTSAQQMLVFTEAAADQMTRTVSASPTLNL
jgi:hypothetical protein